MTPEQLLASAFTESATMTDQPWTVRWEALDGSAEELVAKVIPDVVDLSTSGSTGTSATWRRSREQLWAEAGLLAGLLAAERPQAVLAFAPPRHIYGALASVLVPARLGLPVWYRPSALGPLPAVPGVRRWAVIAIPWVFPVLCSRMAWVRSMERVAVLHSTATLPSAARDLLTEAGPERSTIIEIFGSTESGGVAHRHWTPDNPPWTLLDDVEFAEQVAGDGAEIPLAVRSGRIAAPPGEAAPDVWQLDDYIEPLGERQFTFKGRRNRLVKVNGRRINLDEVEESLRSHLHCADLACLPVADEMTGEHFEVLIVLDSGKAKENLGIESAVRKLGIRPRNVRLVDRINRSETGKLRQIQQQ